MIDENAADVAREFYELVTSPEYPYHRNLTFAELIDMIAAGLVDVQQDDTITHMKQFAAGLRRRAIVEDRHGR